MRLNEIAQNDSHLNEIKGLLDIASSVGDAFRFGKAGSSSKMDIAKANPPKNRSSKQNKSYKNKCGKWDDPKTTGCVR